MDIFEEFIRNHEQDDTARLLLGRSRWPDLDMDLVVHTLEGRRRMRTKAPSWHAFYGLRYPTRLCTEQCSSEATARYKAALARRIVSSGPIVPSSSRPAPSQERRAAIADLTGGLGLDTWAFATSSCAGNPAGNPADSLPSCPARPDILPTVLHNEMNPDLSAAVRHNFAELGLTNVTFRNQALAPGNLQEILSGGSSCAHDGASTDGFKPDLIFLDPARRAADGSKVFRLEDCQPDILTLLPELLAAAPHLLLKISPMADISLVVSQLNAAARRTNTVREVHIVGTDGECKEMLLWLDRDWNADYTLHISEIQDLDGTAKTLTFPAGTEAAAIPTFATLDDPAPDLLLFEPGKALAKAGLPNTLSQHYSLRKLSRHTHLYLLPEREDAVSSGDLQDEMNGTFAELRPFGKTYRILEAHELTSKLLKTLHKTWPNAEVTAKDLPLTSDQLRTRLKVRPSNDIHIFGCRINTTPILLITRVLPR